MFSLSRTCVKNPLYVQMYIFRLDMFVYMGVHVAANLPVNCVCGGGGHVGIRFLWFHSFTQEMFLSDSHTLLFTERGVC